MKIINETPDTMTFEFTRDEVGVLRGAVVTDYYHALDMGGSWETMNASERAIYDYFVEAV